MSLTKKISIVNKGDYIIPLLAITSLITSCIIISQKTFFWNDELYSYYLLADQSFTHMLKAFHDKINNTPPLYFLLGWLWTRVFGSAELSLRLFSSLGIGIACATVWITLRRTYNFESTTIGILSIFCTSSLILSQNAEARMYGLFLAVCSLGLFQYDSINRISNPSWSSLLPNIYVHAAIVNTHLLGLFYSGAILFSLMIRDRYFKIYKPKVYISVFVGWLSLLLYIPSFLNQSDAGNPRTWLPIPTLRDLIDVLSFSLLSFQQVTTPSLLRVIVLLALILVSIWKSFINENKSNFLLGRLKQNPQSKEAEISLLILAYNFIAVPIFAWIISYTIKPLFWDRYFIPTIISWSILVVYFSSFIFDFVGYKEIFQKPIISSYFVAKRSLFLLTILIAILLIQPVRYAKSIEIEKRPGLNDNRYGYTELPIAVQFSHDFLTRLHYASERDRYFFILDWEVAIDSTSGLFPPQEYKHLETLKRNYPILFQNQIIKTKEFLDTYKQFLVLTYTNYRKRCNLEKILENVHCARWLDMRIMSNSNYKVTSLGNIDNRKLLLVEKQE